MHAKEVYNSLTDHEKSNLKKATIEIVTTSVLLPLIGSLLAAVAKGSDDDEIWFIVYQIRRLESELSQYRNVVESTKLIANPVAGVKLLQNATYLAMEIATPINFAPEDDEHFFSYLDEDRKGKNILVKKSKKLIPIWSQLDKNYKQLFNSIDK